MFVSVNETLNDKCTIVLFGPSGIGKTYSPLTIGIDESKICYVSSENGLQSIKDSSAKVFDLTRLDGKEVPREKRFDRCMDFLREMYKQKVEDIEWLVFDSLTEISQCLVEKLKLEFPEPKDGLRLWGKYNEQITYFIKKVRDLNLYNTLFLALDTIDKDENSVRYTSIDVPGSVKRRIPAYVDFCFYYHMIEDDEGKQKRCFITSPYKNIIAKDRSGKLNKFEEANFKVILDKISEKKDTQPREENK